MVFMAAPSQVTKARTPAQKKAATPAGSDSQTKSNSAGVPPPPPPPPPALSPTERAFKALQENEEGAKIFVPAFYDFLHRANEFKTAAENITSLSASRPAGCAYIGLSKKVRPDQVVSFVNKSIGHVNEALAGAHKLHKKSLEFLISKLSDFKSKEEETNFANTKCLTALKQLEDSEAKIKILETRLTTQETELSEKIYTAAKSKFESEHQELISKFERAQSDLVQIEKDYKQVEDNVAYFRNRCYAEESAKQDLKRKYESSLGTVRQQKSKITNLETEINRLQNDKQKLQEDQQKLQAANAALTVQVQIQAARQIRVIPVPVPRRQSRWDQVPGPVEEHVSQARTPGRDPSPSPRRSGPNPSEIRAGHDTYLQEEDTANNQETATQA
ncbi:hypothetical protein HYH03_005172 [Edaphochlamys debaryana]|uniref:Uncharacterized protein n=1 Tax=Edaphochlamys debaryana TaxID=47281 RepID=A0A836C2M5_9CHLO|nr:hypothetical protein HYH03_005172 [Edaphochlamys debaryana]|eukprot:KAG2496764.1 hypothetical protein HYH03_005172 [Edaphochlamys debaryana]